MYKETESEIHRVCMCIIYILCVIYVLCVICVTQIRYTEYVICILYYTYTYTYRERVS